MKRKYKTTTYIEAYNKTWKWEFNFLLGCKWERFREAIRYWESSEPPERKPMAHAFSNWGERRSYIWVEDKKNSASLAHECIHVALRCLNTSGVHIDCDNDEPLAYLVTWLINEARNNKHR